MQAYQTFSQPVMMEYHQFTKVVVPKMVTIHQVVRRPAVSITTLLSPIRVKSNSNVALMKSPCSVVSPKKTPKVTKHQTTSVQQINKAKPPAQIISNSNKDLQNQLNKFLSKLESMDQSINDLSNDVYNMGNRLQTSKIRKNELHSVNELSTKNDIFQTPKTNIKIQKGQMSQSTLQESQINDVLSRIQLVKGTQFGDQFYFGDLENDLKEGYGTIYDKNGRIIYCGYWVKDRYHNRGKLYFYDTHKKKIDINSFKKQSNVDQNSVSYTGQFVHGEIKGLGQMLFTQSHGSERFIYYGRFEDAIFHGRATVVHYKQDLDGEDSEGIQGDWRNGTFIRGKDYSPQKVAPTPPIIHKPVIYFSPPVNKNSKTQMQQKKLLSQ